MITRSTIPKIPGWPIVGVVPNFYFQQLNFLIGARQRYGDIFRIQLGSTEIVVLCHPRHAQHVFIDAASNYRNKGPSGFRIAPLPLMKDGLATAIQAQSEYKQQRKEVVPNFQHRQLGALADRVVKGIEQGIAEWGEVAGGGRGLDIEVAMTRVAVYAIGLSVFGVRVSREEADRLARETRIVMDYLWLGTIENELPKWVPFPWSYRYQRAVRRVGLYVQELIQRSLSSKSEPGNMISGMAEQVAKGDLSEEQLHNEAVTLLIAGYESSAANLAWTLHLLIQNPPVQEKLQDEIDRVLGGRVATFAELSDLKYTRRVLQESLRCVAPSYWTQRMAESADEIDGRRISAGTTVAPMIHLIHHHPAVWKHPEKFDPDRFLDERVERRHRLAWMPFGAGQRKCMAIEFALMKGQLILATVLQRFHLRAVADKTPKMIVASNVRPSAGRFFELVPRVGG